MGSTCEKTADRHVLEGANQVEHATTIQVIGPQDVGHNGPSFGELERELANLRFHYRLWKGPWTDGIRRDQVRESDVVVLVGGGVGTKDIAEIAREMKKPTIPLGGGSGVAADVFHWFAQDLTRFGVNEVELDILHDAFDARLAVRLVCRLL